MSLLTKYHAWRIARQVEGADALVTQGDLEIINQGIIRLGMRCTLSGRYQRLRLAVGKSAVLDIGAHCHIESTIIAANTAVSIGDHCSLGPFVHIMDADFHDLHDHSLPGKSAPIRIGHRVWLGAHVIVLRGVTIGDGARVLPGSVVTKDIPAGVLAGGVPAEVMRADAASLAP